MARVRINLGEACLSGFGTHVAHVGANVSVVEVEAVRVLVVIFELHKLFSLSVFKFI